MTTPLTPEYEQKIRARIAAATPGPWNANEPVGVVAETAGPLAVFGGCPQDRADAAFTAHARDDVPALLDEIDRLRGELVTERTRTLNEVQAAVTDADPGPRGGMSEDYENGWWNSRHAAAERVRRLAEALEPASRDTHN